MSDDTNDETGRIRDLFDAAADSYDHVGVDMFVPIAQGLVDAVEPRTGERVLDIGCGRGAALYPVAAAVGPGCAVGIDLSPRMVELAAAGAADRGLDVDVRVGDAADPSGDLGSFDAIVSSLVLFFLDDPTAALGSWRSRLVDGGRVGVSTFRAFNDEWREVDRVFAPYLPPAILDPRTRSDESPFGSDEGMERMLADAGFVDVRTVGATIPVRFTDTDQWHAWTWSTGQRRMWGAVPEAERTDVLAEARRRVEACRAPDGGLGFDQGVRFTLGRRDA